MLGLHYSLVIEATEDPLFFSSYSPTLEGFTGVGSSVEDCIYKVRWGMKEHVEVLAEQDMPVPAAEAHSTVVVRDAGAVSPAA